jgi:glycerophosphoryl diester phosphodiesterase
VTTATRLPPLSTVRWIAHAGLAAARPGGTPTRETLAAAVRLHVDWIELDVCVTADGRLVVRHDSRLPGGRRVEAITRAELRRQGVDLLTLDEATDVLGRRVPIMLDIKGRGVTRPLARWLARRRDPEAFVVCSGNAEDLLELRRRAGHVARWPSLPDLPGGSPQRLARILRLVCRPRGSAAMAAGVRTAAVERCWGWHELCDLAAMAWRHELPGRVPHLANEVGAAGLTVAYRAISPELCSAAERLRLPVAAWTVNRVETAREVRRCGVAVIVTDRVVPLRLGLAGF